MGDVQRQGEKLQDGYRHCDEQAARDPENQQRHHDGSQPLSSSVNRSETRCQTGFLGEGKVCQGRFLTSGTARQEGCCSHPDDHAHQDNDDQLHTAS